MEPTSMLVPCEGCEENIGNKIDDCVVRLDNKNETEIEIPVAYSKVSTSKTSIGKYKHRIRMPIKNIKKALEIIESSRQESVNNQDAHINMNNTKINQNTIKNGL
ncbi:hypothetical protein Glove_217g235 [Diversispora epigaea]|uniref:Uncharacterized protein n=1 Tax=Diversispora epigaea TaxID=1348612 RepID=A0A397IJM9_9GLOM|nr:hypothetical protein Glove_217g235 [Diversispora epigaea]